MHDLVLMCDSRVCDIFVFELNRVAEPVAVGALYVTAMRAIVDRGCG